MELFIELPIIVLVTIMSLNAEPNIDAKYDIQAVYSQLALKLRQTDPEMYNYFVEHLKASKNFNEFLPEPQSYSITLRFLESKETLHDFDYASSVRIILNELEQHQISLSEIGDYLRDHKFNDLDWRQFGVQESAGEFQDPDTFDETFKIFFKTFPVPMLDVDHYQLKDYCSPEEPMKCIKRIYFMLTFTFKKKIKVTPEQLQDTDKQHRLLLEIQPFLSQLQRFEFRTTASYYMCWYTVRHHALLRKFGRSCEKYIPKYLHKAYESQHKDRNSFDCALLSFCPDVCNGRTIAAMYGHRRNPTDLKSNPCYGIGNHKCEISLNENKHFEQFKNMSINVTCNCEHGQTFSTKLGVCLDLDECLYDKHDCDQPDEACLNLPNTYECICKRGYIMKYFSKNRTQIQRIMSNGQHRIEQYSNRMCVKDVYLNKLEDVERVDVYDQKNNEKNEELFKLNVFKILNHANGYKLNNLLLIILIVLVLSVDLNK